MRPLFVELGKRVFVLSPLWGVSGLCLFPSPSSRTWLQPSPLLSSIIHISPTSGPFPLAEQHAAVFPYWCIFPFLFFYFFFAFFTADPQDLSVFPASNSFPPNLFYTQSCWVFILHTTELGFLLRHWTQWSVFKPTLAQLFPFWDAFFSWLLPHW